MISDKQRHLMEVAWCEGTAPVCGASHWDAFLENFNELTTPFLENLYGLE